jgi:hypothetical protein
VELNLLLGRSQLAIQEDPMCHLFKKWRYQLNYRKLLTSINNNLIIMDSKQMSFPKLSLLLNILVLIPVCSSILLKSNLVIDSYGIETPALGILLSIYLTILIFSVVFLFKFDPKFVMALLLVQVVYKVLSPIMVGTLTNPVIISNLFIALFHSYSIWKLASFKG